MAAFPVELVETARRLGTAHDVVDLGDVSIKDAGTLRVKRSGARLAELSVDDVVCLDRARLDAVAEASFPREPAGRTKAFEAALLAARLPGSDGETPIVNALLHHLLPGRVVFHLHPEALCAITGCGSGQYLAKDWFRKHGVSVIWLERDEEGILLAKALGKALASQKKSVTDCAVLVSNGGVYLQGEEPAEVEAALDQLLATLAEQRVEQEVTAAEELPPADVDRLKAFAEALLPATEAGAAATNASPAVLALLARPSVRDASLRGPIWPDQVVHCGSYPCHVEDDGADPAETLKPALAEHFEDNDEHPQVLLVRPHGLVATGPTPAAAAAAAEVFAAAAAVYVRSELMGVTRIVPAKDRRALDASPWTAARRAAAAG